MQQQLTTGRALLSVAELSEQALIAGDTDRLSALTPQQRILMDQQAGQETARQQAAADLSAKLGLESESALSAMLPRLAPADAVALATLRAQILATQRRLETQNHCNAQLLENALGFIKFNLEALTKAALKPARYGVNMTRLSAPSFYIDSKA